MSRLRRKIEKSHEMLASCPNPHFPDSCAFGFPLEGSIRIGKAFSVTWRCTNGGEHRVLCVTHDEAEEIAEKLREDTVEQDF